MKRIFNKSFFYMLPLVVVLINLIIFNRFYQPTEGWWQTFGYLINKGLVPYRDFSSAIVPLFMYFNAFLLDIFGDKLILFRLFGIITIFITIILLQFLLSKLTDKTSATIAVFIAFALNMSTPVYLAYDYSSYVDILLVTILVLYYYIVKSEKTFIIVINSAIIGIFLALLFLMKQNIGVFFGLAIVFAILLHSYKSKLLSLIFILITFSFTIFKFSTFIDLKSAVNEILLNNDAKGSILTVLLRFILDGYNLKILLFSIIFSLLAFLIVKYKDLIKINTYLNNYKRRKIFYIGLVVIVSLLYLLIFFHVEPFYSKFFVSVMIIVISTFLFIIYNTISQSKNIINNKYIPFILPIVSLAYCTTQTAGYNFIGMYFVVAFSLAYLIYQFKDIKFKKYIYLALILLMINIMVSKFIMPYNWWGLTQSSIFKAKYETNYRQMAGIKVDEKTRDFFNTIKYYIDKFSASNNDVFLYPDIPIFYLLHHKTPPIKSVIQWFDFATTFQLKRDLKVLKRKLPKVIILLKPPEFVYRGHYGLLKHRLIQKDYDDFFDNLVLSKKYRIEYISTFQNQKDLSQFDEITKKIVITKDHIKFNNIVDTINLPIESYRIENIAKKGYSTKFNMNMNMNMNIGDTVTIKMDKDMTDKIVQKLGFYYNEKSNYVLRVLIRNDK